MLYAFPLRMKNLPGTPKTRPPHWMTADASMILSKPLLSGELLPDPMPAPGSGVHLNVSPHSPSFEAFHLFAETRGMTAFGETINQMLECGANPICSGRFLPVGTWLSLVEHSLGVRGVGSSNLPVPTNLFSSCYAGPLPLQILRRVSFRCKFTYDLQSSYLPSALPGAAHDVEQFLNQLRCFLGSLSRAASFARCSQARCRFAEFIWGPSTNTRFRCRLRHKGDYPHDCICR